jgi:hypothetical protein
LRSARVWQVCGTITTTLAIRCVGRAEDLAYVRKLLGAGVNAAGRTVLRACQVADLVFRPAKAARCCQVISRPPGDNRRVTGEATLEA